MRQETVLAELVQALEWIANTNGGTTTDRNLAMKRIARDALAKAKHDLENPGTQLHTFKPHSKFPWFCDECGYSAHEPLLHYQ